MNNTTQSGIYQITNSINGKVYVGQSVNLARRKAEHFRDLKRDAHYNTYLQRTYNKHGSASLSYEVIEFCKANKLDDRERHWIKVSKSTDKNRGYNLRTGGGVHKLTKRSRNKISDTRKKRIREGTIKVNEVDFTNDVRNKMSESIRKYYKENPQAKVHLSRARSSVSESTVRSIKEKLRDELDLTCNDVAKMFNLSPTIVIHIMNLSSHRYILSEDNYIIKNRSIIYNKRKNREIIRLYREGNSYSDIGKRVGIHHRNVIRRVSNIKNVHDDRCRLNSINRASKKKTNIAVTLHNMGYSDTQASKLLNTSRGTFYNIRNGILLKNYTDVNQVRSKVSPFKYNIRDKKKTKNQHLFN